MPGNRKRYDWLFVISDNGLTKEFDKYIKRHQKISLNRAARSFVVKKKLKLWPCYEKANLQAREEYFRAISKCNWIED